MVFCEPSEIFRAMTNLFRMKGAKHIPFFTKFVAEPTTLLFMVFADENTPQRKPVGLCLFENKLMIRMPGPGVIHVKMVDVGHGCDGGVSYSSGTEFATVPASTQIFAGYLRPSATCISNSASRPAFATSWLSSGSPGTAVSPSWPMRNSESRPRPLS